LQKWLAGEFFKNNIIEFFLLCVELNFNTRI